MCFTGGGTGNVLVVISSGDKLSRKTIIKKSRYVLFCVLFCFYKMMERLKKNERTMSVFVHCFAFSAILICFHLPRSILFCFVCRYFCFLLFRLFCFVYFNLCL